MVLIAGLTISGVSLGLGSEMAFLDSGFKFPVIQI